MSSPPVPDAPETPAPLPESSQQVDPTAQLHIRSAQLTVDRWLREVAGA